MALNSATQDYDGRGSASKGYSGGRAVRRRSSKACHSCRTRKIKCSVVKSGIPCSNCGSDDLHCTVSVTNRRKRFLIDEILPKHSQASTFSSDLEEDGEAMIKSLSDFLATAPTSLDFTLSAHVTHMPESPHEHTSHNDRWKSPLSSVAGLVSTQHMPSPTRASTTSFRHPNGTHRASLPNFVYDLPSHLGQDDIEFLERRGVLRIPNIMLRNELLRNYVQFVHPLLPFLDLKDFLEAINRNGDSTRISLMVFHAVMFAAAAFVDIALLKSEGYETRKAARKSYFEKAKLLYHFDYDSDRISIVQTLVLMTYWYEAPDVQKDPSHWVGTCLSFAYTIGLHRNAEQINFDPKERRMRKRLWWSCFMRERLIAISMRKPTHIRRDDYDVPMLSMEDLDTQPLSQELIDMLGDCSAQNDRPIRTTLAKLCIEKVKLCVCIADVLATQYYVQANRIGATSETTMMITPKKSAPESYDFIKCEQGLNLWYGNLPKDCQYKRTGTSDEDVGEVIQVHRAILSMIYSTTLSALHRPRIVSKLPSQVVAKNFQQLSRQRVREAAIGITDISQDLHDHGQVRFLPPVAVTVLMPAALVHILDMRSTNTSVRDNGLRRYYQCMDVLQRLREMYYSADAAFMFLEAAVNRLNIDLPKMVDQQKAVPMAMVTGQENAFMEDATAGIPLSALPSMNFHDTPNNNSTPTSSALAIASAPLASGNNSNLPVDVLSNEDLGALNYFNMWPHMFEAESGLSFDPDVDWAMDFSAYLVPDLPTGLDQAGIAEVSAAQD